MTGREHMELYTTLKGLKGKADAGTPAEVGLSPEDSDQ